MTLRAFDRSHLPSTPWKNGAGRTTEVVRIPHAAPLENFDWRVSIAELSADAPFSSFPGVDRIIALLSGDGVRLRSHNGRIDRRLDVGFEPFAFAGEETITASLIGGASTDFNVMTRRDVARADLQVLRASKSLDECASGALFAARGTWVATAGPTQRASSTAYDLGENAGVWWEGEPLTWDLRTQDATAVLFAVRVSRTMSR